MTLATGTSRCALCSSPKRASAWAFTIIELLLVMGLMAFATTLFLFNFSSLLDRTEELRPEEVLREAVMDARFFAARERLDMFLSLAPETGALQIQSLEGALMAEYPLGSAFTSGGQSELRFVAEIQRADAEAGFGGRRGATTPLNQVVFSPDRSSTPFTAVLRISGEVQELRFEPFSGLVVENSNP